MEEELQKVDSLREAPIRGRQYLVPSVVANHHSLAVDGVVPIIGQLHEDKDFINFPDFHWHVNLRFIPSDKIRKCKPEASSFRKAAERCMAIPVNSEIGGVNSFSYRPFTCKRKMPEFPTQDLGGQEIPFIGRLQEAYQDQKMKCMTCPHRGFDLNSMPVREKEGVKYIVCHGHGLAWNIESGEMIKRDCLSSR